MLSGPVVRCRYIRKSWNYRLEAGATLCRADRDIDKQNRVEETEYTDAVSMDAFFYDAV
jgi:hypothetical protein